MRIKDINSPSRVGFFWRKAGRDCLWRRIAAGLVVVAVLFLLVVASMRYGIRLYQTGQAYTYGQVVRGLLQAVREPTLFSQHYVRGLLAASEAVRLDIKFNDWQVLVDKHAEVMAAGTLFASENPTVPAKVSQAGKTLDVDLRLKGGVDHQNSEKWSWRLDVKDDGAVLDLKEFSLQHPKTREYLHEWIFHEVLRREELIALQYDFVDVTINGEHKGIYALEEHFSGGLLERNKRREGVIISLDEELFNVNRWPGSYWDAEMAPLRSYDTARVTSDPVLSAELLAAKSLWESYRRNETSTCEVFDCGQLATYFAVLDILGANHAADYGNFKLYYNPITARLEPIGFDAEIGRGQWPAFLTDWAQYDSLSESASLIRRIFSDRSFMEQYVRELTRLTEPAYLDSFFADSLKEMETKLGVIYKDDSGYKFDKNIFYQRQRDVRQVLEAKRAVFVFAADKTGAGPLVEAGGVLPVPIRVLGMRCPDGSVLPPVDQVVLPPLLPGEMVDFQEVGFSAGGARCPLSGGETELLFSLWGQGDVRSTLVSGVPRESAGQLQDSLLRQVPNHATFSFIAADEKEKVLLIKPGRWVVDRTLVIPPGYSLQAGPGTELDLINAAHMISYSPLDFRGSEDGPVVVHSSDGGSGVAVLQADGESRLDHVIFTGLTAPHFSGWQLTGAVTFYESDIMCRSCLFSQNRESDDALNVVRSRLEVEDSWWRETWADALDTDFCTVKIKNSLVAGSGNDGFDFSGSEVALEGVTVKRAGDKGFSVGENTRLKGEDVVVQDALVGVASKDGSEVELSNLKIQSGQVGLAVYQKKPEYGAVSMSIRNLTENSSNRPMMAEEGSQLTIDGVGQKADESAVLRQLEDLVAKAAE
ncbi:MAG: CotH kinase family protein [bacterium]